MPFPKIRLPLLAASILLLGAAAQGGTFVPEMAPFVTRIKTAQETDLAATGLVAFVQTWPAPDSPEDSVNGKSLGAPRRDIGLRMDVKNLETGNLYRMDLQPDFLRFSTFLKGGDASAENISDSVAFYALPPGTYAPHYVELKIQGDGLSGGSMSGSYLAGPPFLVTPGAITSFSRVELRFSKRLFRSKLRIATVPGSDIESLIRAARDPRIAALPITAQALEAAPPEKKK